MSKVHKSVFIALELASVAFPLVIIFVVGRGQWQGWTLGILLTALFIWSLVLFWEEPKWVISGLAVIALVILLLMVLPSLIAFEAE